MAESKAKRIEAIIKKLEQLKKAKEEYRTDVTEQLVDEIVLDLVDVEDCIAEHSRPEDGLGGYFFPPTGAFTQNLWRDVRYVVKSPKPEDIDILIQHLKIVQKRVEKSAGKKHLDDIFQKKNFPMYPFKSHLTTADDYLFFTPDHTDLEICEKAGGGVQIPLTKEQLVIIDKAVGSRIISDIKAFLIQRCNVQNVADLNWDDILGHLRFWLKSGHPAGTGQENKTGKEPEKGKLALKNVISQLWDLQNALHDYFDSELGGYYRKWFEDADEKHIEPALIGFTKILSDANIVRENLKTIQHLLPPESGIMNIIDQLCNSLEETQKEVIETQEKMKSLKGLSEDELFTIDYEYPMERLHEGYGRAYDECMDDVLGTHILCLENYFLKEQAESKSAEIKGEKLPKRGRDKDGRGILDKEVEDYLKKRVYEPGIAGQKIADYINIKDAGKYKAVKRQGVEDTKAYQEYLRQKLQEQGKKSKKNKRKKK